MKPQMIWITFPNSNFGDTSSPKVAEESSSTTKTFPQETYIPTLASSECSTSHEDNMNVHSKTLSSLHSVSPVQDGLNPSLGFFWRSHPNGGKQNRCTELLSTGQGIQFGETIHKQGNVPSHKMKQSLPPLDAKTPTNLTSSSEIASDLPSLDEMNHNNKRQKIN